jgi:hypothetical protein
MTTGQSAGWSPLPSRWAVAVDAGTPSTTKAQFGGKHPLSWAYGLERMTGIEPAYSAWEADVLPLNYIRSVLKRA